MLSVAFLIIISVLTGYLLTYFLSARYSIFERTAYGAVVGLALYTWIAYLFSMLWGLQFKSICFSALVLIVLSSAIVVKRWASLKNNIVNELSEIKNDFLLNKVSYYAHIAVFSFFATIFWRIFYRTILWKKDGMYVGLTNNYGDLPLHLGYITSFVWGENIPPQDPVFAGEKLVYPFLSDFLSAIFLKLGLDFRNILFIPGLLLTVAFYVILYYFAYRLTKKRLAAVIAAFLFFFSGGFGFYYFFYDFANTSHGIWSFLMSLPRDYTKILSLNYHWITPLTCLTVPQRPFLFGFPITMLIVSILYTGIEQNKPKEFLFAGFLAGMLPLFHSHSFLAMLMVTLPLGVIFWDWRKWFLFFMPAFILSLPQVLYLSAHVGGGSFFAPSFGWMADKENFFWFWLKNTSVFWPVVIGGFAIIFVKAYGSTLRRTGFFALPFLLLFLLPNLLLFAPWNWDNIKILIYWFLGVAPIAAYALSCLYENKRYKILSRTGFFIIMILLTIAGAIDVFKYAIAPVPGAKEFSSEEIDLASRISLETPAPAIFLNAPIHNHLVFLSGRKTVMGFFGHIWSHGYRDIYKREQDVVKMLKGTSEAISLLQTYKPDYVIIGPHEKSRGASITFFDTHFTRMITTKNYKVYDINKRRYPVASLNENSKGTVTPYLTQKKYGLKVSYYDNVNWEQEPVIQEIDEHVRFNWAKEEEKPLSSPFSALWEGYLDIEVSGKYLFKLTSDDGSWLYIDDILIIDNGGHHSTRSVLGAVSLEQGSHKISIKYFDAGGGAVLSLLWTPPKSKESGIPAILLKVKK